MLGGAVMKEKVFKTQLIGTITARDDVRIAWDVAQKILIGGVYNEIL